MTLASLLRALPLAALSVAPWTIYAQQASNCSGGVSYSPANPIYGQPVTVTLRYQSLVVPNSGQNLQYAVGVLISEPGYPTPSVYPGDIYFTPTPENISFTFTPYEPGNVTVQVSTQPYGNYDQAPLCGQSGPGGTLEFPYFPIGPAGAYGNMLNGQYAFLFQGLNPQIKGSSDRLAAVGSLTADGQGNVTGTEDVNSGGGSVVQLPVTGTYTLDALGHGTLKLATSLGVQQLGFFVPTDQLAAGVTKASLIATDGYVLFGNGSLVKQTLTNRIAIPTGSFAINLSGDFQCSSTCSGGDPIYETGDISLSGRSVAGQLTGSVGSVLLPLTQVGGSTSTSIDSTTGRFTYGLSQGPFPLLNFVAYPIDATHFYTMSTDSHASTYLLSGVATQ